MYTHIYYDADKDYRKGKIRKEMRTRDRCKRLKVLCESQALLRSQITSDYLGFDDTQREVEMGKYMQLCLVF